MSFANLLPYALLVLTGVAELPAVGRRRPDSERKDAGSFMVFNVLFAAGFFGAFWVGQGSALGRFPEGLLSPARAVAIALVVLGFALRSWSIHVLGAYFTRTVQVSKDQPVVQTGPYRLIRHPSYSALGLEFVGVALALTNGISLALVTVSAIAGCIYRIRVEEAALVEAIGEPYAAYMKRTRRLIPFVF